MSFDALASDPHKTMAALIDRMLVLEPRLAGILHAPSPVDVSAFFDPAMVHHGGGGGGGTSTGGRRQNMTSDDDIVPPDTLALYRVLQEDPQGVLESPPPRLSLRTTDVLCRTPAVRLPQSSPTTAKAV